MYGFSSVIHYFPFLNVTKSMVLTIGILSLWTFFKLWFLFHLWINKSGMTKVLGSLKNCKCGDKFSIYSLLRFSSPLWHFFYPQLILIILSAFSVFIAGELSKPAYDPSFFNRYKPLKCPLLDEREDRTKTRRGHRLVDNNHINVAENDS